jgi:hypothetical protein
MEGRKNKRYDLMQLKIGLDPAGRDNTGTVTGHECMQYVMYERIMHDYSILSDSFAHESEEP